jgi:hypothetical protein
MKKIMILFLVVLSLSAQAQNATKKILVEQLKNTHNVKNWFVPVNIALEGLTAEQAMWTDGSGNHSAGQLAYHLWFWNMRQLNDFKGIKNDKFSGDNEETFNKFNQQELNDVIQKLDAVLTEMEKVIEAATDKQITEWASTIANVNAHNAYHTGQIIFVRKLQGSWNPEKGVK